MRKQHLLFMLPVLLLAFTASAEPVEEIASQLKSVFNTSKNSFFSRGTTSGLFGTVNSQCGFSFDYDVSNKALLVQASQTVLAAFANHGAYFFAAPQNYRFFGRYGVVETVVTENSADIFSMQSKFEDSNGQVQIAKLTYKKRDRMVTLGDVSCQL